MQTLTSKLVLLPQMDVDQLIKVPLNRILDSMEIKHNFQLNILRQNEVRMYNASMQTETIYSDRKKTIIVQSFSVFFP